MTDREALEQAKADAQAIYEWLREPDFAEFFGNKELADWLNRRPSGKAKRLSTYALTALASQEGATSLCSDCPREGYPTDETRCLPCPRRQDGAQAGEARPVGYMRKEDMGKRSFWVSDNKSTYYTMPVYTTPPAPADAARATVEAEREALCDLLYKRLPPGYCNPIVAEIRARKGGAA
jgi:hypothetical protein